MEEEQASSAESGEKKGSFTPFSWILLISGGILVMLFAYTYMTNCSIVVCSAPEDGGLGLSASVASTVLTVMSVAFAVCGLLYGAFFVRVFQQYTTVFAVLLLGIGLIIAYFAESFAMMCLASVVFGLGFPMFNDAIVQALGRTVSGRMRFLSSPPISSRSAGSDSIFLSGDAGHICRPVPGQYPGRLARLRSMPRSGSRRRLHHTDRRSGKEEGGLTQRAESSLSICGGYERIKCG